MIKQIVITALAVNVFLWGKPPGDILFSSQSKALDEFKPYYEAKQLFNKGERVYFYIYSTKKFKTDKLYLLFIHLDNKGVLFPKTEIAQTIEIDVDPESTATKGEVTLWKGGQFYVKVFSPIKPKKAIAEADLLIK